MGGNTSTVAYVVRPGPVSDSGPSSHLPVLFVSGYFDDLMAKRGQLPEGVDYLQKPFDATTLAKRVRAALDRAGRRG